MDRRDLQARARAAMAEDARRMAGGANPFVALLRAMRPRQWLKNLLVFVPMLAGHALAVPVLIQSLFAFLAFSMCASSAYLLSDTLGAKHDRQHPAKGNRPIASGALSAPLALSVSAVLAIGALALSAWAEPKLLAVVAIYFAATILYSAWLERLLMVDIVALALLYCARIIGGSVITHIALSFWLLAFSFLLFLSLALLKRHSELAGLHGKDEQAGNGRGYTTQDRPPVAMMGVASGFLSVLIVILYLNSPNLPTLYRHPLFLAGIVPLLVIWLGRLWTLSFRGQVNEDPLLYVSKDPVSIALILACMALAGAASY